MESRIFDLEMRLNFEQNKSSQNEAAVEKEIVQNGILSSSLKFKNNKSKKIF